MHNRLAASRRSARRGFSFTELIVLIAVGVIMLAVVVPALAGLRSSSQVETSISNLMVLGMAHGMYSADWNGRQFTQVDDELSTYGSSANQAIVTFSAVNEQDHPPILLGWGDTLIGAGLIAYYMSWAGNHSLAQPLDFGDTSTSGFGWYRVPNARGFRTYVANRYYDPVFYAPGDTVPFELASEGFDLPSEFTQIGGNAATYWSSYSLSAAALYNPDVLRHPDEGGFQDPFQLDDGFTVPSLNMALHPDLKTHMLEHHWIQNRPSTCNEFLDGGAYDDCEPWYFNHGNDSAPVTLFYDGHVRLLPQSEAQASDQMVLADTGSGLWSRDTPFGEAGFFLDVAFDLEAGPGSGVSHHMLTTRGILGRDTLGPGTFIGGSRFDAVPRSRRQARPDELRSTRYRDNRQPRPAPTNDFQIGVEP